MSSPYRQPYELVDTNPSEPEPSGSSPWTVPAIIVSLVTMILVRAVLPLVVDRFGTWLLWPGLVAFVVAIASFVVAIVSDERARYAAEDARALRRLLGQDTPGHESLARSSLTGVDQSRSQ